jgi:hypothetical protein
MLRLRLFQRGVAMRRFGTSPAELAMESKLKLELKAVQAQVDDVSGGCGR